MKGVRNRGESFEGSTSVLSSRELESGTFLMSGRYTILHATQCQEKWHTILDSGGLMRPVTQ
jgi:hypothetical protein